jgi:prepilin-type N-terminal cleavage/methylation domain-containing protein
MNKQYKQQLEKAKGFTIIEVVLVLAIAGLIFLMVFIALPALQRGQRDAQRKQDLSRISVQMTNYISASKGSIILNSDTSSGKLGKFVTNYLRRNGETTSTVTHNSLGTYEAGDDYKDPTGPINGGDPNYTILNGQKPSSLGQVGYYSGSICSADDDSGVTTTNASSRGYALTIQLESQNIPYCIDNRS